MIQNQQSYLEIQLFQMITIKAQSFYENISINDFTTELLSKLLSDLYMGVHLKVTMKFGSKDNFFIERLFFI